MGWKEDLCRDEGHGRRGGSGRECERAFRVGGSESDDACLTRVEASRVHSGRRSSRR